MKKLLIVISFLFTLSVGSVIAQVVISAPKNVSGSGSGCIPSGTTGDVQLNSGAGACTADSGNFNYSTTSHSLLVSNATQKMTIGSVGSFPAIYGGVSGVLQDMSVGGPNKTLWVGNDGAGSGALVLGNNGISMRQSAQVNWVNNGNDPSSGQDTGLTRNTSGVVEVNSGSQGQYADLKVRMLRVGQTTVPTCTANCGTTPSIAGSNTAMTVTLGTGSPTSGFVITFNGTWATAPECQGVAGTSTTTQQVTAIVTTTTTMTVTTAAAPAASAKYHFTCIGIS